MTNVLGQTTQYPQKYDPSLLFCIPRKTKRDEIGVNESNLPFHGCDIWNHYEVSWLNQNGKPVIAIAELIVPATTKQLVESKSLKLYFNSFNMEHFESADALKKVLHKDLEACYGESIAIRIIEQQDFKHQTIAALEGVCIDGQDIEIDIYQPNPDLLSSNPDNMVEETLVSHLLESHCLVTNQPDWGSVQVYYQGPKIDQSGLLKYIVSLRQHNEFHEQCVERLFVEILNRCKPNKLAIYARYTRRGGIDINPFRANCAFEVQNVRTPRQ